MSFTSDKPSIVQGNNSLQGNKEVNKTETNTKRVMRQKQTLRSTEQVRKTSKSYERKLHQVPNESSNSPKRIHMV